jgi:hypothetical protein
MLQKKKKEGTKAKYIKCEVCEGMFNLEEIDTEKSSLKRMNICRNCSDSEA